MTDDGITILRGADGEPQHVVLAWGRYDALRRGGPVPSGGGRVVPDAVAGRLAGGASPVRAWRDHRGFSQAQLAALSGISRAYLTQIETGERVGTLDVMARLAGNLGCLIDDLVRPTMDDTARSIAALAAMPARVAATIAAVPRAGWATRPSPAGFSLVEHVCHLRDIDADGYRVRIARILAEDTPELPDIDGDALARERAYHAQDLSRAFSAFAETRAAIVEALRPLSEADRRRRGRMMGAGEVDIDGVVAMMLAHDSEHLAELAELPRAVAG